MRADVDLVRVEQQAFSDPRASSIGEFPVAPVSAGLRRPRPNICRALGRWVDAEVELKALGRRLDVAYQTMAANLPTNSAVRIEHTAGRDRLVLTPLDALPEPPSLPALRVQVAQLLPRVDLPEALLEIHARTGFGVEFTHFSESAARVADLPISLCAVLIVYVGRK